MTMNDTMMAVLSAFSGGVLGAVFFVGLWWTVREAMRSQHPGLLVLASMLWRTGLVVEGFYLVSGGQWQRLLFCLAGFIFARMILLRVLPKADNLPGPLATEMGLNAP
ncbi:F1F0 ATPase subunit 2 [Devosia sp. UYZn731]|uniref:ATP synthase subunit I n=1 Tax=Devosia sp. UYZn731 TaxID=3156345 RepID=UPI003392BAFD